MAAFSTDTARKQVCEIIIVDVRNADKSIGKVVILVFFSYASSFLLMSTSKINRKEKVGKRGFYH